MSTVMSTARTTPTIPGGRPTSPIPRLRRGVSLIVGMDNQPMLFDSDSGKYHRLGAAAAFIVNQFDGVRPLPTIIEELPQDIDEAGAQRITGLIMALYTIFLLCSVYTLPQLDYISWSQLFQGQFMKVATMVAVLALIYHAWVGIRDLYMDYLKNTLVRLVLEVGTIVLLTGYASWAAFILWRA